MTQGIPAPVVLRFERAAGPLPDEQVPADAVALQRDEVGNVVGGIRTPWVRAPLARYLPHSTPAPALCRPSGFAPMPDEDGIARMIGHMTPLPDEVTRARFPERVAYLAAYRAAADALVAQRLLLAQEQDELVRTAAAQPLPTSAGTGSAAEPQEP